MFCELCYDGMVYIKVILLKIQFFSIKINLSLNE